MGPERWGSEGWGPEGWGAQIFALFSLSRPHFHSFFPLLRVSSWNFGGVFEGVRVWALGLSCETPAASGPPGPTHPSGLLFTPPGFGLTFTWAEKQNTHKKPFLFFLRFILFRLSFFICLKFFCRLKSRVRCLFTTLTHRSREGVSARAFTVLAFF